MVEVLGIGSIVRPSKQLENTLHLFMTDFDNMVKHDVLSEARRIHEDHDIDVYVLESSRNSFHALSFDVLTWKDVRHVQAWIRLDTDFPMLGWRFLPYKKHYLTLRLGTKLFKASPQYVTRFCSPNTHVKSEPHYRLYQQFCGVPSEPSWYRDDFVRLECMVVLYYTYHNLSEAK